PPRPPPPRRRPQVRPGRRLPMVYARHKRRQPNRRMGRRGLGGPGPDGPGPTPRRPRARRRRRRGPPPAPGPPFRPQGGRMSRLDAAQEATLSDAEVVLDDVAAQLRDAFPAGSNPPAEIHDLFGLVA